MMQEQTLTTPDGLHLRAGYWLPENDLKAMVTLCHGHSEHVGRYAYLAEALNAAGYGLYMADLRGHGKSDGKRGHIDSFADYQTDYQTMLEASRELAPDVPHVLGGHSMGGLIAAYYALHNDLSPYEGLILSSAWIETAAEVSTGQKMLAAVASKIMPGLQQPTGLDASLLTHDAGIVQAYENDPLVHGLITAGAYTAIMEAQAEVLTHALRGCPLYMLHGSADGITSPQATRRVYEASTIKEKTYRLYDGLYHELFNENERDAIIAELIAWLDDHV